MIEIGERISQTLDSRAEIGFVLVLFSVIEDKFISLIILVVCQVVCFIIRENSS